MRYQISATIARLSGF